MCNRWDLPYLFSRQRTRYRVAHTHHTSPGSWKAMTRKSCSKRESTRGCWLVSGDSIQRDACRHPVCLFLYALSLQYTLRCFPIYDSGKNFVSLTDWLEITYQVCVCVRVCAIRSSCRLIRRTRNSKFSTNSQTILLTASNAPLLADKSLTRYKMFPFFQTSVADPKIILSRRQYIL